MPTEDISSKPAEDATARQDEGVVSRGYAWYVVFILMLCYALSLIDRQILSLLVGPLKRDLHVSDTRIGLLQPNAGSRLHCCNGSPIKMKLFATNDAEHNPGNNQ